MKEEAKVWSTDNQTLYNLVLGKCLDCGVMYWEYKNVPHTCKNHNSYWSRNGNEEY